MEKIELDIPILGYYLDRALCVMIKKFNKELREKGLNFQHPDYTVLKVLSEKDGLSQTELSWILGKERSGICRTVSSLEKEGYIFRTVANGRTNNVFISEKGKSIMPLLNSIADQVTEQAFRGFSEKKRKETMKILTTIYKNSL